MCPIHQPAGTNAAVSSMEATAGIRTRPLHPPTDPKHKLRIQLVPRHRPHISIRRFHTIRFQTHQLPSVHRQDDRYTSRQRVHPRSSLRAPDPLPFQARQVSRTRQTRPLPVYLLARRDSSHRRITYNFSLRDRLLLIMVHWLSTACMVQVQVQVSTCRCRVRYRRNRPNAAKGSGGGGGGIWTWEHKQKRTAFSIWKSDA